jgi:hypothetical protein
MVYPGQSGVQKGQYTKFFRKVIVIMRFLSESVDLSFGGYSNNP